MTRTPSPARPTRKVRRYGSWASPLSARAVAAASVAASLPRADGTDILWTERRPAENARVAIVRRRDGGAAVDVIAAPFSARSRVHEYGGGAFAVSAGRVCFVNEADQDLYLVGRGRPRRLTQAPDRRFADMAFDPSFDRVYAVAERHGEEGAPQNTIAAVALSGERKGEVNDLLAGRDFYASPRPSPDGTRLAWLAWDLPAMPWDAAELWTGRVAGDGGIVEARRIAGGGGAGVFQPEWSADGALYFVADRDGWGNLHVWRDGAVRLVAAVDADLSRPLWSLGATSYAILEPRRLIGAAWRSGILEVGVAEEDASSWTPIETDFARVDDIAAGGGAIVLNGGGHDAPPGIHVVNRARMRKLTARRGTVAGLSDKDVSRGRVLDIATAGGTVRALFYPPQNAAFRAKRDALPPLVVQAHGGPTAMARRGFQLECQYWTTRGFALLDVDYRGSTGYGRAYQKALDGHWGEYDAIDTVAAARFAAANGLCDPGRMVVRGGSAGGLTVLNALISTGIFAAGASYYGVADLERLAADTHKFESGYLDALIGGSPEALPDVYRARSPVHHADRITAPVIFFQGLEDRVVPPSQSRAMVRSLTERGIPVASFEFAGEGHGFRKPETIAAALGLELAFYARILGLAPAEPLPYLTIANFEEGS